MVDGRLKFICLVLGSLLQNRTKLSLEVLAVNKSPAVFYRKERLTIMDRRNFMKGSLLALGGSTLAAGMDSCRPSEVMNSKKNTKLVIDYPQKSIPEIVLPPCRGEWYEDTIPDTLDIAGRCELAINALTGITDPNADYEVYWQAELFRNPPVMMHDHNDWVASVEGFMEALPLLRAATGR